MPGASRRHLLQAGAAALVAAPALAAIATATAAPASVRRWDQEYDVVVVGFGVGGGAAALEAAKAGAKVLLLDPPGGQLSESHGGFFFLGGGTALQKELQVDDDQDNFFRFLMSAYQPAPAEARIRQFCERNPEHYDWLVRRLGLPFGKQRFETAWPLAEGGGLFFSSEEQSWPHNEVARPAQHCHVPVDGHAADKTVMRLLAEQGRAAGVVLLAVPAARSLAVGADGRVEGVLATIDGQMRAFRARRGVVLATGGFANNRAMVAQHLPHFLGCSPSDGGGQGRGADSTESGWGHRAGMAVGAAVERMDGAVAYYGFYPPLSRKEGILVNAQGQRFVPEDAYYGRVGTEIVLAQKGVAHFLLDGPALGGLAPGPGGGRGPAVAAQGSSLAEIERTLGLPATVLQSTLEFYNRHAAQGVDPLFRKNKAHLRPLKPPFTVLKASVKDVGFTFFTVGGLSTNASGQVLDNEGAAIAGLYACGRVAAGIATPHYVSSGLSMSESTLTGRIAGLAAARQTG